ncbi:RNA polymerase II-associated factor 1-like protein [Nibea albiflora]|uniref:RNA polymerase II-associated factor 1-like protein n=1 Tax=Nibea albiflora TaxID=240163 RepID=A0ACB7EIG7_NIBAL|nr:RNA polymerase II-associated factor 1-like protein [Nibea albiflora]
MVPVCYLLGRDDKYLAVSVNVLPGPGVLPLGRWSRYPYADRDADLRQEQKNSAERTLNTGLSGVVCRVKYCNSLPDIPFDPKFITYPFDQHSIKPTSLEKQHKHELLTEPDLGVTIDLINPDTYRIDPNILLDPADEKLLEEDIQAPSSSKRSQQHAKVVPWMRKTEYISTEFNRYGVSNEKVEVKIGVSVKQQFTEEEIYKDRDSQISAIEKTFEDAQKSITQHYSKPRVTPVEVLPVFPDFKMWINPCAQVIFDSDPAPKDISGPAGVEMMSQAMIRGMMDEEGNQFVAYFLPHEETLRKRKRDCDEGMDYMPEDLYDYKIAREYNWNVKNKASKGYEENYFFIFRDGDGVYYNELETRVRLSKRRAKAGAQSTTNAVLVCKHRDMNEKELEAQEARKAQLENHEPEDEEEDMDMDKDIQDSGDDKEKGSGSEAENSGSESEREDEDREQRAEEDEDDEDRGKRRRKASGSGSESGEERTREMRDEEEIFGSDDDSDDNDDNEHKNSGRSSGEEGSGSEDEGGNRGGSRSRSASPARSDRSSDHSERAQSGSGSERGSDSSDGSDSE